MPSDHMDEPQVVPWLEKDDLAYYGPFRDNVRSLIKTETEPDDCCVERGVLGHTVTLGKGTTHECRLRIYEETMLESTRVHCDCCRCIGWHHHPVTRKQYHFIIHTDFRVESKPELLGKRICQICTAAAPAKDKTCPACGENDKATSILDYQTHLMHGTLHANGCGHLMRINGREAGSLHLSGQQLIQIWEKLCTVLNAREVSVEDVSQKYGVEFRLLNPVACGKTWYGTYGYRFGKGSFGNTAATHQRAAERLRGFPLVSVAADFLKMAKSEKGGTALPDQAALEVITRYQVLMKQYAPKTLGGLVALLLLLQRIVRRNDKAEKELVLRERRRGETGRGDGGKKGKGAASDSDANGNGNGTDRAQRRREEEREACAKRKAASSLFEPLKFESKATKASKLGHENKGGESSKKNRVMSAAKPRVTPLRPLRPRGADGLVPSTDEHFVAEPAPAPAEARRQFGAKHEEKTQHRERGDLKPVESQQTVKVEPKVEPLAPTPVAKKKPTKPDPDPESPKSPSAGSRWSEQRIETACTACVEVLREANGRWMARRDVRGAAREKGVGDTGLLDHVLKTISDAKVTLCVVDKHKNTTGPQIKAKVRRRQNASTGQLEYHLDKVEGMRKMRARVVPPKPKQADLSPVVVKKQKEKAPETSKPAKPETGGLQKNKNLAAPKTKPGATGERRAAEEAARQLSKSDLDRDVKVVYKTLLESYLPARALVPGAGNGKSDTSTSSKNDSKSYLGFDLIECARVLLDTKQFVKTYTSVEKLLAMKAPVKSAVGKATRVMVTAVIDSKHKGPKVSGMNGGSDAFLKNKSKAEKAKRARSKTYGVETKPPPEVVLVPPDATLGELKQCATKCFQHLYVVLGKFKVKAVIGFENVKDGTKIGKKLGGKKLLVHGEGADLESEFRYQGGLDQWTVRCVCGTSDDDGQRMIACDNCEVWMHTRCVGIGDDKGTPRRWTCVDCEAEAVLEAAKAAKLGKGLGTKRTTPYGGKHQAQPVAKKSKPTPAPVPRNRPPPKARRPPPERVMPRRKGSAR